MELASFLFLFSVVSMYYDEFCHSNHTNDSHIEIVQR